MFMDAVEKAANVVCKPADINLQRKDFFFSLLRGARNTASIPPPQKKNTSYECPSEDISLNLFQRFIIKQHESCKSTTVSLRS